MSHYDQHTSIGKSARNRIRTITGTQVQNLIAKLDAIKPSLPSSLPLQNLVTASDYTSGEINGGGGKHVLQECSILGNLRRMRAFDSTEDDTTVAIEVGAGTGRLSERLQRVTDNKMIHVMIDRQDFTPAQCRDGKMRKRAKDASSVKRIVGDIAHFDLNQYCADGHKSLCMSKHLCGPACDLAIACLEGVTPKSNLPPFAFATCCHYLCTFDTFAGKDYWLELGLNEEDFEVAVAVSQWCSLKKKDDHAQRIEQLNHSCDSTVPEYEKLINKASLVLKHQMTSAPSTNMPSEEFERTFSNEGKSKLGEDVKRLLDMLRVAKLQRLGYKAQVVLYTNKSIENRLLVGAHVP